MKKVLLSIFLCGILGLVAGCSKSDNSSNIAVDFSTSSAEIFMGGQVTIPIVLSEAPTSACSVSLSFAGSAVKGTDYSVSSEKVNFAPGEIVGSIVITDLALSEGKDIKISIEKASGLKTGSRGSINIVCRGEALVCNFITEGGNVIERFKVKIKLSGIHSGDSWTAPSDIDVPVSMSGDGAGVLYFCDAEGRSDSRGFRVQKGSNTGELWISIKSAETVTSLKNVTVMIDNTDNPQFITGDKKNCTLQVQGNYKLTGRWTFDHIVNEEAVKNAFTANGDDISLLPLNNKSFYITISEEDKGDSKIYKMVPSSLGAFANYFRQAEMTNIAPEGLCDNAEKAGFFTAMEQNRFILGEEHGEVWTSHLFFKLSAANLAFDPEINNVGEGCISMRFAAAGQMEITIRRYNKPPFGVNSWNEDRFDPEMFGFTAIFKKEG